MADQSYLEAARTDGPAEAFAPGLADRIAALEPRARDLLRTLVGMPSGSYEAADVDALGDRLATEWQALGFADAPLPVPGRGCIRRLSRQFPGERGGRILILGHLDTVWSAADSAGWDYAEDGAGMASGPGVGDMKGGLAMAWLAVAGLLENGTGLPSEIAVMLVPDEELGSPGSRAEIEAEAARSRAVLVLEPSRPGGEVVMGRGAVGAMVVTARGRTAHVGVNPEEGISALVPMAALAVEVSALDGASVGVLRSGAARQVVPETAEMHVDLRAPGQEAADALAAAVKALVAAAADANPQVRFDVAGGVTRPAFPPQMGQGLFGLYSAEARALGLEIGAVVTRGGSDGSFGAALGVPTLDGLGPVCFDTCSRRERIVIASLAERATLLAALIAQLASAPDMALA
ncbi:M20/M25/M40 family metallo-hydrolase [Mangrovicoccus sp. HB161399]|uniref:M20/M25/M40 family metallo-hydrolase n=1 Tax=Mangrovicoccus sp. HB161399 TaxID=2720392 RepID=UPI001551B7C4|nr:M20/M25/M40 family metallo-hydrolase [Mangrovicoccus sp. HB161399]